MLGALISTRYRGCRWLFEKAAAIAGVIIVRFRDNSFITQFRSWKAGVIGVSTIVLINSSCSRAHVYQ
jgi:hypothetical protein